MQLIPPLFLVAILPKDVEHLIKATTLGTDLELHQAINDGFGLVANHPNAQVIPSGSAFNLWPFATFTFFLQLNYWTFIEVWLESARYQTGPDFFCLLELVECLFSTRRKFCSSSHPYSVRLET